MFIGVDNKAKIINQIFVGVDGKAKLIYSGNGSGSFELPTFTGSHSIFGDEKAGRIEIYESGTLVLSPALYDFFIVGGGGQGGVRYQGGGGGGYTKTVKQVEISSMLSIPIIVGAGGGVSSVLHKSLPSGGWNVNPGVTATGSGGSGGSGGGGGGSSSYSYIEADGGNGGADGSNGSKGGGNNGKSGGVGQGTTTRMFEEPGNTLYAGGGGGAPDKGTSGKGGAGGGGTDSPGSANTGGGGAGHNAHLGGSGIVIIRWNNT